MEASYPAEAKLLAQAGQITETSALFIWNRIACSPDLPHDCRAHDDEMAPKHKKDLSRLKNITKCRANTRIRAEKLRKTYLSIRMYF
jgi:hypothetical protein